jgi:hypothetical protein
VSELAHGGELSTTGLLWDLGVVCTKEIESE